MNLIEIEQKKLDWSAKALWMFEPVITKNGLEVAFPFELHGFFYENLGRSFLSQSPKYREDNQPVISGNIQRTRLSSDLQAQQTIHTSIVICDEDVVNSSLKTRPPPLDSIFIIILHLFITRKIEGIFSNSIKQKPFFNL